MAGKEEAVDRGVVGGLLGIASERVKLSVAVAECRLFKVWLIDINCCTGHK